MWEADPMRFLATKTAPDWARRIDIWNGAISRHRIPVSTLPRKATRENAALALYHAFGADPSVSVIGEKSPYYSDILKRLAQTFPHARFIIIRRDLAATMASVRQAARHNRFFSRDWMPLRVVKDAGRLERDAETLKRGGHAVIEIRFEDLVANATAVVTDVWKRLDLEPIPVALPEADFSTLPPGEHHRLACGSGIDPERAVKVVPDPCVERHLKWRGDIFPGQTGPHNLPSFSLACDEVAYQGIRSLECLKRLGFRNAPLSWLASHRVRSQHQVGCL